MAEERKAPTMEEIEEAYAKRRETDKKSFLMYEETIKDAEFHYKNDFDEKTGKKKYSEKKAEELLADLRKNQDRIVADFIQHGGDEEEIRSLAKKRRRPTTRPKIDTNIQDTIIEMKKETKEPEYTIQNTKDNRLDSIPKGFDNVAYDLIPLPSNGEAYPEKMDRIPIASLTAEDENVIVNPNLYRDNLVMDVILKNKIMNGFDQADLLEGDREAIILYLRSDGYGNDYPVTATDDVTGEQFDTVVDLSKIKYKDFTLKGDERGEFEFQLPVSKHIVKFRFLRHRDIMDLQRIEELEKKKTIKPRLEDISERLNDYIEDADNIGREEKIKIREAIKTIDKWSEHYDSEDVIEYTRNVTNRMEMSIMEVDGNRDRNFISRFVSGMKVKDSAALRKYINDNEPGLDYNIEVERPGGGVMSLFLQLDQYIFLNQA